ncbi:MAG: choice-of-anchor D domain-containing protein, partial [Verrucomicrobiota bacterium]
VGITNLPVNLTSLTSATARASFNGVDSFYDVFLYWGLSDGGTNPAAWDNEVSVGSFTNQPAATIGEGLTGLDSTNTYFYAWRATNCAHDTWGQPSISFFEPDMQVLGINGTEIADGSSPDADKGSDFGTVETFRDHTFTIRNLALGTLRLNGAPVISITGSNAADFVVFQAPADPNLTVAESTTFIIRFSPGGAGVRTALLTIQNNDPDEAPYTFQLRGELGIDTSGPSTLLISVCGYGRSEFLLDFPVLVQLSTNILGFRYDQFSSPADGADLRISSPFDGSALNYEIESWDTNGTSYVWVQMPSFSDNQCMRLTWGSVGLVSNPPPVYTTNGVTWSNNFRAVWHMAENAGPVVDASPNNFDGLPGGGVFQNNVTGVVDGANTFDGSFNNAQINLTNTFGLGATNIWSISFWAQQAGLNGMGAIIGDAATDNSFIQLDSGNNRLRFRNTLGANFDFATPPATAAIEQYVLESMGTNLTFYRQGVPITTVAAADVSLNVDALGRGQLTINSELAGILDEVRVSDAARGSNWHWAAYLNVVSNDTLLCYSEVAGTTFATNYVVFGFGTNLVYDGQIASGDYSVQMGFESSVDPIVTNAVSPSFDIRNSASNFVVMGDVFTNRTSMNNGFALVASNDTVTAVAPANITLGTYNLLWGGSSQDGAELVQQQLVGSQTIGFNVEVRDHNEAMFGNLNNIN